MSKGHFSILCDTVTAIEKEYATLSTRQCKILGAKGFRKVDLNSLTKLRDERLLPMLTNTPCDNPIAQVKVEAGQMELF